MATPVITTEIPTSQGDGTGSQTVPAGKYWIVTAVRGATAFVVNGVTLLAALVQKTALDTTTTGPATYTVPAGYNLRLFYWYRTAGAQNLQAKYPGSGVTSTTVGLNNTTSSYENISGAMFPPGTVLDCGGSNTRIFGVLEPITEISDYPVIRIKLEAGETIQGGQYHYEEYDVPGAE